MALKRPVLRVTAKLGHTRLRLIAALSAYCVLALIATYTLDGFLRTTCYFFFALLTVKTIRHSADQDSDSDPDATPK